MSVMNIIGKLEVIEVPDEGRRYCIHLNRPDIMVLRRIKYDEKLNHLDLGKYKITEDYEYIKE